MLRSLLKFEIFRLIFRDRRSSAMSKEYQRIDGRLRDFIERQPVFFVATAPLTGDGHVNLSPKGRSGSLTVLDPHTVAYRSEEHTSELQSPVHLVCRLLLEKKKAQILLTPQSTIPTTNI